MLGVDAHGRDGPVSVRAVGIIVALHLRRRRRDGGVDLQLHEVAGRVDGQLRDQVQHRHGKIRHAAQQNAYQQQRRQLPVRPQRAPAGSRSPAARCTNHSRSPLPCYAAAGRFMRSVQRFHNGAEGIAALFKVFEEIKR